VCDSGMTYTGDGFGP